MFLFSNILLGKKNLNCSLRSVTKRRQVQTMSLTEQAPPAAAATQTVSGEPVSAASATEDLLSGLTVIAPPADDGPTMDPTELLFPEVNAVPITGGLRS